MTTMTTQASPPASSQRYDEKATGLRVLLKALDDLGLSGTLTETRSLLARAIAFETDCLHGHSVNRKELDELISQVADGTLDLERLVARAAELTPWLDEHGGAALVTPAWSVTGRVVAVLRDRAHRAAVTSGLDVHAALSKLAAGAVKRGVDAGRRLVDVKAVCVALRPPDAPPGRGPLGGDPFRGYVPPPLSTVTLEAVQADAVAVTAWATASRADAELSRLYEVAEILHKVAGGASTAFAGTVNKDQFARIGRELPVQVHLAVADALGWKPGLHLDLKPRAPRPPQPVRDSRFWQPGQMPATKVGPYGLAGAR